MHARLAPSLSGRAERDSFVPRQSGEFPTAYARDVLRAPAPSTVNPWAVVVALLAGFGFAVGVGSLFMQ